MNMKLDFSFQINFDKTFDLSYGKMYGKINSRKMFVDRNYGNEKKNTNLLTELHWVSNYLCTIALVIVVIFASV